MYHMTFDDWWKLYINLKNTIDRDSPITKELKKLIDGKNVSTLNYYTIGGRHAPKVWVARVYICLLYTSDAADE